LRDAKRNAISTGCAGLDDVLAGGLPPSRLYLVQGDPGAGKTTLALQFLRKGVELGESTMFVTLSETTEELSAVAASHGWSIEGIHTYDLSSAEDSGHGGDEDNTLYVPAEVELGHLMDSLLAAIDRLKPRRIVIDSCSELRLLAQTPLRFRRQILALKRNLVDRDCTILVLENPLVPGGDVLLQSLVHGVISMEQLSPLYGAERRRLRVLKLREVRFRGGFHDFVIDHAGGVTVFPRLVAAEHHRAFQPERMASGLPGLDSLLGGGLGRGTSTLFLGPAGSGKSLFAARFAVSAAERGEKAAIYSFDEGAHVALARTRGVSMPLEPHIESGHIALRQIDAAEMSPGQFIHAVREDVESRDVKLVIIDSLNGFMTAMPEESFLVIQMHELLAYLAQRGVATIMVVSQYGMFGAAMSTPVDISYVADSVVLFRYFEARGRVRKAVSVVKSRLGKHEDTIR
jgi:circadian clock protein KaiC